MAKSLEGNPSASPNLRYTYTYDATLGIKDPAAITSFQIEIYPNPFTGKVNLKVPKGNKGLQLEILDMVGHQVFTKRIDGGGTRDLNNPTPGFRSIFPKGRRPYGQIDED